MVMEWKLKINNPRGTLKASSPGVDVEFKNSWVKGAYPS